MNNGIVLVAAVIIATALVYPQTIRAMSNKVAEIFMDQDRNTITKLEAFKRLIMDGKTKVYRCSEVELTENGQLRKRKK